MASLYEIDQRLMNLESYGVDTETGEVAITEEDFNRMFNEIQMDMKDQIVNTACFIKNLKSDIDQFKAEEEKLKQRRQVKEKLAERLQNAIDDVVKHRINNIDEDFDGCNKWKIDVPQAKLSYRKSTKVEIIDENKVPEKYKTKVEEIKISKTDIGNDLKAGIKVDGAELVNSLSLQIK